MFDLGWTEMLLVGIVALIVIGPKDLPVMFKKAGEMVGRLKAMAREFTSAMEDAAKDSGMNDIKSTLNSVSNPMKSGFDSVKSAAADLSRFDPESETGKLSKERAEAAKKIHEATAQKASERLAKEAADKAAAEEAAKAAADTPASTPKADT